MCLISVFILSTLAVGSESNSAEEFPRLVLLSCPMAFLNSISWNINSFFEALLGPFVCFRQAQSGWRPRWWMALGKLWWACGGPTPPWMNLTRQSAPQKPQTAFASFAPRPRSTPCECRCASGCLCVPCRPTPYRRTPPGRTPRSPPNPAQFAKWPAALVTLSLKCVR